MSPSSTPQPCPGTRLLPRSGGGVELGISHPWVPEHPLGRAEPPQPPAMPGRESTLLPCRGDICSELEGKSCLSN